MTEVPVEPGLKVMLAGLLASVKLPVPLLGACQKFPQPANSGAAASTSLAHLPIFIAAPYKLCKLFLGYRYQGTASG